MGCTSVVSQLYNTYKFVVSSLEIHHTRISDHWKEIISELKPAQSVAIQKEQWSVAYKLRLVVFISTALYKLHLVMFISTTL